MTDRELNLALSKALDLWKPAPDARDWGMADYYEQNPQPLDFCSDGNDMLRLIDVVRMHGVKRRRLFHVESDDKGDQYGVSIGRMWDSTSTYSQDKRLPRAVATAAAKALGIWKEWTE